MITSQDASDRQDQREDRRRIGDIAAPDPNMSSVAFFIGGASANQANLNISLAPRDKRTADQRRSGDQRACGPSSPSWSACRPSLQSRSGHQRRRPHRVRPSSNTPWPTPILTELNTWGPKLLTALRGLPELKDVSSDQQSQAAAVDQPDHRPPSRRPVRRQRPPTSTPPSTNSDRPG